MNSFNHYAYGAVLAWIWEFTIPKGATATISIPGEPPKSYAAGSYCVER